MNKFKVVGLRALVRFLAIVIFLLTSVSSCGIVYVASSAVFYPEQTEFPNGVPPAPFAVVIENRAAAGRDDAFGVIRWEKAAAMVAKDGPDGADDAGDVVVGEDQHDPVQVGFQAVVPQAD